jgi:phosphinothricin acetyltransferase
VTGTALLIRDAILADAAAIRNIYAPYVADTIVSFEIDPPSTDEMARRLAEILKDYPFLVAERDGAVVGYAYAGRHNARAAYRHSVDVTVYIAEGARRSGVGRALYGELFRTLKDRGFHMAYAGISLPNEPSVGLHEAIGFTPIGIYREVGFKFGKWIDVGWWQRRI